MWKFGYRVYANCEKVKSVLAYKTALYYILHVLKIRKSSCAPSIPRRLSAYKS